MNILGSIPADELSQSDPAVFTRCGKTLYLNVKRVYCAYGCKAVILCDDTGETKVVGCVFDGICGDTDTYKAEFDFKPGLYYVTFELSTEDGGYYVHSKGDEINGVLRKSLDECGRFQVLVTTKYKAVSKAFKNGTMYHIFVDRFYKSGQCGKRSDAKYVDDWENGVPEYTEYPGEPMPNNTFFGGDLYGITEKLPYIKKLGCDIVYLSPIFEAYSNHKYDTGDYTKIDACFGGEDAFVKLCEKAHKLKMKVILDGVFNHTGDDSVYFNKYKKYGDGGAYNDRNSPYFKWFSFNSYPDDYACWWGVKALPELCADVPEILDFFTGDNGIIRKYLRLGADGWRLDVADELSETLLDRIKRSSYDEKRGSIVIGEVWEDASNKQSYGKRRHYFSHGQLDSVMNYPLKDAVIDYAKNGVLDKFRQVAVDVYTHYPENTLDCLMNFLGSHDTERIMTVLGGEPAGGLPGSVLVRKRMTDEQYETARQRFYIAFSLLCFCPGIVSVYYGDEAGMQGYRDPFNRMPYPWGREDEQIKERVKRLLYLHKDISGKLELKYAKDGVLILQRSGFVYISNMSKQDVTVYTGGGYSDFDGNEIDYELTVKPMTYHILHKGKQK